MRAIRRIVSLGLLGSMIVIPASLPAVAQSGAPAKVTHRQSVQTELSPTGGVGVARVYTQVMAEGEGTVDVALPGQATGSLRNLEGFGGPTVDGDTVTYSIDAEPDGVAARTVADHTADQPVDISVVYELDGEEVAPRDVVGAMGTLTATYTVQNLTSVPEEITYFNGQGQAQQETVDVSVPMVGSLSTTLDGRFSDVTAPGAAVAGDGRGNTVVNASLLLFAPIGSETAVASWSAQVDDAIVPPANIQILPVNSRSFNSIRSTQDSFKGVSTGLTDLTNGALIVDGNAKLLADGAAQLFDGLQQLEDGAGELGAGLSGTAAPGARTLSDGLGTAREGGDKLANGLGDLSTGAGTLSAGLTTAREGGDKLADGLGDLSTGAGTLSDGLGTARAGSGDLAAGLGDLSSGAGELSAGLGAASSGSQTLNSGLDQLAGGAAAADAGAQGVAGGLATVDAVFTEKLLPGIARIDAGLADVEDGLTLLAAGSAQAEGAIDGIPLLADGAEELRSAIYDNPFPGCAANPANCGLLGALQIAQAQLESGFETVAGACAADPAHAACGSLTALGTSSAVLGGSVSTVVGKEADVDELAAGLDSSRGVATLLEAFATNLGSPDEPGPLLTGVMELSEGASELDKGLNDLNEQAIVPLTAGSKALAEGTDLLTAGAGSAAVGASDLAAGLVQLDDGAGRLADGSITARDGAQTLSGGLVQLDDGAGQLADGSVTARDGARALQGGLVQLDDGAGQLADGSNTAREGAQALADGLVQLDDGAERLAGGLQDAADGSVQLAEGAEAAAEGGEKVADGTVALSEQGIGAIITGATDAAGEPDLLYEHLRAADRRGQSPDALPYGTTDRANASAVFAYELAGIGVDEGPSVPVQGALAIIGLALMGGLGMYVRRRVV